MEESERSDCACLKEKRSAILFLVLAAVFHRMWKWGENEKAAEVKDDR
jgi:hypothetical protein